MAKKEEKVGLAFTAFAGVAALAVYIAAIALMIIAVEELGVQSGLAQAMALFIGIAGMALFWKLLRLWMSVGQVARTFNALMVFWVAVAILLGLLYILTPLIMDVLLGGRSLAIGQGPCDVPPPSCPSNGNTTCLMGSLASLCTASKSFLGGGMMIAVLHVLGLLLIREFGSRFLK